MKKHLFMMSLAIAFIACSKSEDDSKGGDIASQLLLVPLLKMALRVKMARILSH